LVISEEQRLASEVIYQRVRQITCANCQQVINVAMQKPFTQIDCPNCKSKLSVPAMLGPFMLLDVLGTGGMGAVYRAMDQSLGRFVAIKVMKKQLGDDQKLVESFLREARAAAALNHANIVQIYSCGEQSGQPYIAMELVSGGRLDLMMENGQLLDETRLLQISLDVANGLSAANEVNLVHGDIKPANILFDKHGVSKIVDFGLAQFVNRSQEKGEIWGTPYYISPERARGGKADHRSDIYSLGATMFHALTGKPPFDGPTASDVVVARLKQPVPDILEFRPDLTKETAELIERMMATDPTIRYPTSASLLADVKAALAAAKSRSGTHAKSKGSSGRPAVASGEPSQEEGGGKNKATKIIGAVVALVLIGGAVAYFFSGNKGAKDQPPGTPFPVIKTNESAVQAQPKKEGPGETFFREDARDLANAIEAAAAKPELMAAALDAFAKNAKIPPRSGRSLWLQMFKGLGGRLSGHEADAAEAWSDVAGVQITAEGSPNRMPREIARVLVAQMTTNQFATYSQTQSAWYRNATTIFVASESLHGGKYIAARPLLDAYATADAGNPAWPFAMQKAVKGWLATIDKYREVAIPAKNRNDQNAVKSAWEEAKKELPPLFGKVEAMAVVADVGAGSPAAQKAAVDADIKTVDQALEVEKNGTMTKRDYTAAADNLVAINQKLTTREGRERLANIVNQLDRMDAVKNIIINNAKTTPFKQRTDIGNDLTAADAKGFKAGGKQKTWGEISNGTLSQIAAWYVNNGSDNNKKKADDMASIAIFCAVNGDKGDARRYAADAKSKDSSVEATLKKLAPGI
jgi:serine/threonine protein kinase